MKINLDEIPESGLSLDVEDEGRALNELAGGNLDFSFLTPVKAHLEISKHGRSFFISGDIKTEIRLNCSRCTKEFDYPYEAPFSAYYERAGKGGERDSELKPADLDVNFIEGGELDTAELLLGQIALELPMQPLCTPECRGLCPRCGADLNLGDCGCGGETRTDSRFAKLKDFKVK